MRTEIEKIRYMRTFDIKRYFRRGAPAALALMAGLLTALSSCTKEPEMGGITPEGPVDDGKVQLALHTNADDYKTPVTRAGAATDDADGSSPYSENSLPLVLVFELPEEVEYTGSASQRAELLRTQAVFKEAALAVYNDAQNAPTVTLLATARPVRLLILANPPGSYYYNDGTAKSALLDYAALNAAGSPFKNNGSPITFAKAVDEMLNTAKLPESSSGVVGSVPYVNQYTPMSGFVDLVNVSRTSTIGTSGSKLALKRVVARITVENTAANFTFQGATVLGAKQYGLLYRSSTTNHPADNQVNYLGATSGQEVIGIAKSSTYAAATAGTGNTDADPIYVYESAAGEVIVLVQGKYNNTDNWYRMALKQRTTGTILSVERNRHYRVTIEQVTGYGYSSLENALAGSISNNIRGTVTSSELSGHEIIDNGQYYMGLTNSVFIYYSDATAREELLTTIDTDAPVGTAITITPVSNTTGITLNLESATVVSGKSTYTLNATLTAGFTADVEAIYTVKVGNLEKELRVIRHGAGTQNGVASPLNFGNGLVAAKVTDGGGWLSVDLNDGNFTNEVVSDDIEGDMVNAKLEPNYKKSGAETRYGEIVASVSPAAANINGRRVKYVIHQNGQNYGTAVTEEPDQFRTALTPYVGAFWKASETGERLISMPGGGSTQTLSGEETGHWVAFVGEEGNGMSWIVLDTKKSPDTRIWTDNSVAVAESDPAYQPLNGGTTEVSGEATSSSPIYFRIGLKSQLDGGNPDASPRYGVVYLVYNDLKKMHKIYVRQGEAADFLMAVGDAGMTTAGVTGRPSAKRFMPYNLTTDGDISVSPFYFQETTRGGVMTSYPTQAGAYWQFSSTNKRYAYTPINQGGNTYPALWSTVNTTAWSADQEVCPTNYRRPSNTGGGRSDPTGSELWQSLIANQGSKNGNSVTGYYADGFFDRKKITQTLYEVYYNTAVLPATVNVGYVGRLFFNPVKSSTHYGASIFLPQAGGRNYDTGAMSRRGRYGTYWSSTVGELYGGVYPYGFAFDFNASGVVPISNYQRSYGLSVRCVRENN